MNKTGDQTGFKDDEELQRAEAAEHRRWLRYFAAMALFALGMLLAGVGFALGDGDAGRPYREILAWMTGAAVICVAIGMAAMLLFQPNANTRRLRALTSRRDRAQKKQAEAILVMPAMSLYLTFKGAQGAWAVMAGTADFHDWLFALTWPVLSLAVLAAVAGLSRASDRRAQRLLDDELIRSFRHRSLMLGFAVLLAGFIAVFAVALWNASLAISSMPLVLTIAAAAAAIRFALLDHEAAPYG